MRDGEREGAIGVGVGGHAVPRWSAENGFWNMGYGNSELGSEKRISGNETRILGIREPESRNQP